MKRYILFLAALLIFSGCGSSSPTPVEVKKKKTPRWTILQVKANVDDVTIENIIINGGSCEAPAEQYEKKTLKSSESISVSTFGCANVTSIQVVTKTGSYDFSFK